MVAFLCCAVAQQSLFAQLFPNPTGINGYEDYVRAADMARNSEFSMFRNWLLTPEPRDVSLRPTDVDPKDSDLTVRRKWDDRFGSCLRLIETGNRKRVTDPREEVRPETTFPEVTYFKALAGLDANEAHLAFAQGATSTAIADLETGLAFADNVSGGTSLIVRLVGVACQGITFSELDDHWPQLSVNDAHELKTYFAGRINERPRLAAALDGERLAMKKAVDLLLARPLDPAIGFLDDAGGPALLKEISKLSQTELNAVTSEADGAIDMYCQYATGILSGPESGWLTFKELPDSGPGASLAQRTVEMALPSMSRVFMIEARERTKMRIAYLTASAAEYRWINGHLPDRIEDFTTGAERLDPTSGKNFLYRREGPWFRIVRNSKDPLGDVTLHASPKAIDPDSIPIKP